MCSVFSSAVEETVDVLRMLNESCYFHEKLEKTAELICKALRKQYPILFCGNGGSAADAQHLAAELSGRYLFDRPPLNADALHCNTSYLTAVANDYGYENVYARLVKARGVAGGVLVGLSTSGNSPNVVSAMIEARRLGMSTVAFTGSGGGQMAEEADILLDIPTNSVPRVQEAHILVGHTICQIVESELFSRGDYS